MEEFRPEKYQERLRLRGPFMCGIHACDGSVEPAEDPDLIAGEDILGTRLKPYMSPPFEGKVSSRWGGRSHDPGFQEGGRLGLR